MSKEKDYRVLEVRTGSGQLLFSLWLIAKEQASPEPPKEEKSPGKEARTEEKATKEKGGDGKKDERKKDTPSPGSNESMMTESQKRYLFRILAEQGFEPEAAHEELKKSFQVDHLKKVSKLEASREIDRRLEGLKEGGAHG
jgi:hypothetical protein